ncbi:bifunctional tetrahydrofolate synthase/dihydrofolate synthase [Plesiomonas shigelloides]|uniref:bifunctional tetrahydrofolate synthase/dihydrofolate synthase n=1 Tax=Plesiomonas shigelloides TaxID=703 RepID=UPI00387F2608
MNSMNRPQATSPLATWLSYLESLHSTTIDLGLDRIRQVAQQLALQKPAPLVITVAGTNGKGTTCRTLEIILLQAGYRVGVYSSPHLLRYTERVRVQGQELDDALHSAAFDWIESGRGDVSLTYFEYSTLSALKLFRDAALDVVILEVGLGGRLDATNLVDCDVAVITSIDLDHTDWLGHDRETIGREKAGILRGAKPAIVGEPDMPASIATVAAEVGAQLLRVGHEWNYARQPSADDASSALNHSTQSEWQWQCGTHQLTHLPMPQVPLANAATALTALHMTGLAVSEDAIRAGLQQAALPGRFQQIQDKPRVILDVAHNPHAARYLAARLQEQPKTGRVYGVVGMLADKDVAGALSVLVPHIDQWLCATLEGPRGQAGEALLAHLPASHAHAYDSVVEAWDSAMAQADEQDLVIVFGSFYTVAHVMEALDARNNQPRD